jgi:hypothetical protein
VVNPNNANLFLNVGLWRYFFTYRTGRSTKISSNKESKDKMYTFELSSRRIFGLNVTNKIIKNMSIVTIFIKEKAPIVRPIEAPGPHNLYFFVLTRSSSESFGGPKEI